MSLSVSRYGRILAATCAATLLAGSLATSPAQAATGCRVDPILYMRSPAGVTDALHFGANISDTAGDVQSVSYTIHIPTDAHSLGVSDPSDDALAGTGKEAYTIVADNPSGYYTSVTTVKTGKASVSYTAFIQVQNENTFSRNGYAGQSVKVTAEDSQGQQN